MESQEIRQLLLSSEKCTLDLSCGLSHLSASVCFFFYTCPLYSCTDSGSYKHTVIGGVFSILYSQILGGFLRSFWTLYLLSGQLSEGRKLFYQKYVKSYGYDKMKYSWPWSFIFVSRDLINGRRKFEPNKQVFYRSHQEFIWEKYLGSAVRNCYVCCDLTTTWY